MTPSAYVLRTSEGYSKARHCCLDAVSCSTSYNAIRSVSQITYISVRIMPKRKASNGSRPFVTHDGTTSISPQDRNGAATRQRQRRAIGGTTCAVLCLAGAAALLSDDVRSSSPISLRSSLSRKLSLGEATSLSTSVAPLPTTPAKSTFDLDDCIHTQRNFWKPNAVMIYDPTDRKLKTYIGNIDHENWRRYWPQYLLSRTIFEGLTEELSKITTPFQILFSTLDYPDVKTCLHKPQTCKPEEFAPVFHFGSVPRNPSLLPTVKGMPLITYIRCMMDGNQCQVTKIPEGEDVPEWDDLIPQILWRGTDYAFLHAFNLNLKSGKDLKVDPSKLSKEQMADFLLDHFEILTPRWRGIALSLKASLEAQKTNSLPWIDAKFYVDEDLPDHLRKFNKPLYAFMDAGNDLMTTEYMREEDQMNYKYLIDFGGGGGTTWERTIRSLAMPGVLFHHETIMKDSPVHNGIKPYVHYIPVKMDCSDLREQFEWAEANPDKAKEISDAATEYVREMATEEYRKQLYQKDVRDEMKLAMESYRAEEGETVQSILQRYGEARMPLELYATCDEERCTWEKEIYTEREYSKDGKMDVMLM